ncbi:MAG: hypothetical protein LBH93_02795, partial [Chitinispirillales bacterium]|nr:hypothetical protein [Chitinispirillales bacterium]
PHVCADCNGGLGGTVDVALKNVFTVALACFNRGVGWAKGDERLRERVRLDLVFKGCGGGGWNRCIDKNQRINKNKHIGEDDQYDDNPFENPDIKGAILKIAYEAAHLRLGGDWLDDPAAVAIREILFAYVNKDKEKAHALANGVTISNIPIDAFYFAMRIPRSDFLKRAIAGKTCLNSLWLSPKKLASNNTVLILVFDIEGIPPGYAVVSESAQNIAAPELLAPKIK